MAQIGLNHRLSVSRDLKAQTRALYQEVFHANLSSPHEDLDAFSLANGSGIGVFYVDPLDALTPEDHMKAIWLEFEVPSVEQAASALASMGIRPFDYFDKSHHYFQAPGGQCFRLAER